MKKLWVLLLAYPIAAFASQPMTAPPQSHPKSHFALMPGHHQLILNVTRWTSFKIESDYPVTIFEKGCRDNRSGVTNTAFVCDSDLDITITDDRPLLDFFGPPNVVRIKWISTRDNPIPVMSIAPGSH